MTGINNEGICLCLLTTFLVGKKGDENIILSLRRQPVQAHQKYAFSFVVKECELALLHLLAWAPLISM